MPWLTRDTEQAGVVGGLCFVACLLIILLAVLVGCTPAIQHQVTAPQLDEVIKAIPKPCQVPPPIPAVVTIAIDGQNVDTDEGGELLLRSYVSTRSCLKGAR